ncbi:MAG TPA: phosphatidylglycerophosphatase A [Verrucomicrobiae bacterium]|nr:phosphatidylglycerophosphatase A [Verrucomicrobiae bacterium]
MKSKPGFSHLPNALSALRAVLGCILPYFIFRHEPQAHQLASWIYGFAAFTDQWDGLLARKMGVVSDTGKYVDPLADKVLILGPLSAFAALGYYSFWWVVPVFAREIIITFCRTGWLLEGKAIGAEKLGKFKMGLQIAAVSFSLIYQMVSDYHENAILRHVMFFFVVAAVIMTIVSGITFMISNHKLCLTPFFAKYTSAMGVGLFPGPAGTWGSLLAIPLIILCSVHPAVYAGSFVIIFCAGWWGVRRLGLKEHEDPSYVVVDETCGMMLALAGLPLGWMSLGLGFLLFRFFDILKPFPLRRLEKIHGFWGIMLDDLGAGIYSWLILKLILG